MTILVYNLSPQLSDYLTKIDLLRTKIATVPLSPKENIRHKWEAKVEKIYWSMNLANIKTSKKEIVSLLSDLSTTEGLKKNKKEIVNYANALNHISFEWLASEYKVTLNSLKTIYNIAFGQTRSSKDRSFKARKKDITKFLNYIQEGGDHPIIQAGIAYIQTYNLSPFVQVEGRMARLTSNIFLYKNGYDFRGLLVFDEIFKKDLSTYHKARDSVDKYKTLTLWLEYFAYTIGVQAGKVLNTLTSKKFSMNVPAAFWKLNERQKQILNLLEKPGTRITTKAVHKHFGISQITASRDLKKLTKLNLLFTHGQGRSTYYTKGVVV